jgi:transposase
MTNLKAEDGLAIYFQRMKIEEAFRDLKSLLNFHKLMNKRRNWMEKMIALVLIAYAIALILGEALRTQLFPEESRKHKLYSGVFIFLKLKPDLSPPVLSQARSLFSLTVCPVRTHV